MAGSLQA